MSSSSLASGFVVYKQKTLGGDPNRDTNTQRARARIGARLSPGRVEATSAPHHLLGLLVRCYDENQRGERANADPDPLLMRHTGGLNLVEVLRQAV